MPGVGGGGLRVPKLFPFCAFPPGFSFMPPPLPVPKTDCFTTAAVTGFAYMPVAAALVDERYGTGLRRLAMLLIVGLEPFVGGDGAGQPAVGGDGL